MKSKYRSTGSNRELRKIFEPIFQEERKDYVISYYENIIDILTNTSKQEFKKLIKEIEDNPKEEIIRIFENIHKDIYLKFFGEDFFIKKSKE